jgi:sugar-specific transcriptional regulator TrmB
MDHELAGSDFQRFWRRLQQVGLNSYEARSYLVLVGHTRFKALEVAARAHVPRQKIYEVLAALVQKGFAQVVSEKTKLFSAVEPNLALPAYLARARMRAEQELAEQSCLAAGLTEELAAAYSEGKGGHGTLDYLRIISEPMQSAHQYRRMLAAAREEYVEFSRPPYAVDPIDTVLLRQARMRGVACRILVDPSDLDEQRLRLFAELAEAGVDVRQATPLPLKLALFDGCQGLIALLDPVSTRPAWTSLGFDHPGLGEAMKGLFEERWKRATTL